MLSHEGSQDKGTLRSLSEQQSRQEQLCCSSFSAQGSSKSGTSEARTLREESTGLHPEELRICPPVEHTAEPPYTQRKPAQEFEEVRMELTDKRKKNH